ncbi:MAG TPA: hypothetical protein PLI09_00665 [Candidatus Hydrogenedentes bacterium]|nr:hypothetical protein [Candidatus Hydrogenedentota bacterium]
MRLLVCGCALMALIVPAAGEELSPVRTLESPPDFFPAATQFSPVPSGKGWKGEEGPLSEEILRDTIDTIREHGFTGLEGPTHRPPEEEAYILNYAQSRGMFISWHAGGIENFGRDTPPAPCVYSPEYAKTVRAIAEERLKPLAAMPRLYNVFPYQDEPFTGGEKSFGYNDEVKAEFKKRYGYDLPPDLNSLREEPQKWRDVLEFRTSKFPDGWRQVYPILKEILPGPKMTLTHDSHNTFGAGVGSNAEIAIDDVYHWGGDFADMFVFDIYPYMMFDFRFGECSKLPKPRISQTHYAFAHMRNLASHHGKDLGFWVGTYNPAWFDQYLCPELQAKHWSEREMSTTAVAAGANYLLTGYKIPVDAGHWASLGKGLQLIQKTGGRLLKAPKVKANACMLFPRTQYIQLQEEFFNVGLSFELFLRAFGELDLIHEDQITDDQLEGYPLLVLFDVKLLPKTAAERIAGFVRRGGVVIADCVPQLDELRQPLETMKELFGVRQAATERIHRTGCWVPYRKAAPYWFSRPDNAPDESRHLSDAIKAGEINLSTDIPVVSPRACVVSKAEVLGRLASEVPALMHHKIGKGQVFLLGFCVQDTYFRMWQEDNPVAREALRSVVASLPPKAGIQAHVYSSNADIEASLRANDHEGFLFVINHEASSLETVVRVQELSFSIGRIIDLANNASVEFERKEAVVEVKMTVPLGETRLLSLLPEKK